MSAFSWLFVGNGVIARRVAGELGKGRILGVTGRTPEHTRAFAHNYGCRAFSDLSEALEAGGFDAAYVNAPNRAHFELSRQCLLAGLPVLTEKPVTLNAAEAEELIRLSKERRVFFCEGMWTRFSPIIQEVVRRVRAGELGKIRLLRADFCYPYRLSGFSQRVFDPEGGGALMDAGIYTLSFCQSLLGLPGDFSVRTRKNGEGIDLFDEIEGVGPEGAEFRLRCSIDRLSLCRAEIRGTRGKISIPLFFKPVKAVFRGQKRETMRSRRGFCWEFEAVERAVRAGEIECAQMPHADSLAVMRWCDAIRKKAGIVFPSEQVQKKDRTC